MIGTNGLFGGFVACRAVGDSDIAIDAGVCFFQCDASIHGFFGVQIGDVLRLCLSLPARMHPHEVVGKHLFKLRRVCRACGFHSGFLEGDELLD